MVIPIKPERPAVAVAPRAISVGALPISAVATDNAAEAGPAPPPESQIKPEYRRRPRAARSLRVTSVIRQMPLVLVIVALLRLSLVLGQTPIAGKVKTSPIGSCKSVARTRGNMLGTYGTCANHTPARRPGPCAALRIPHPGATALRGSRADSGEKSNVAGAW